MGLDLASWRIAINAAEPALASTIEAFTAGGRRLLADALDDIRALEGAARPVYNAFARVTGAHDLLLELPWVGPARFDAAGNKPLRLRVERVPVEPPDRGAPRPRHPGPCTVPRARRVGLLATASRGMPLS